MKTTIKTLFPALMMLAISCKKESSAIQSSGINNESSTQAAITDMNELGPNVVKIGTQVWKTKNLDVARYRNGDRIPQVKDPAKWAALTTGAWCWYNNDSANGAVYGRLYNWYAVNDSRGLAPEGWHIPSDDEWDSLTTSLGGALVAGGKMKSPGTIEAGTGLWYAPNKGPVNRSGFLALPGGGRYTDGSFDLIGGYGYWWSSTESNTLSAWKRSLYTRIGSIIWYYDAGKKSGYSVRCLRD